MTENRMRLSEETKRMMAEIAIAAFPREACGLIVRDSSGQFGTLLVSYNMAPEYDRYSIDPELQRIVLEEGRDVIGVFHSHAEIGAELSGVDVAMMDERYVYVVYSVRKDELRAWSLIGTDGEELRDAIVAGVGETLYFHDGRTVIEVALE